MRKTFALAAVALAAGLTVAQAQEKVWKHGILEAKSDAGFIAMVDKGGFAAKRGTAAEITSQLNKAINKVLAEPNIRASLDKIGAVAVGGGAAEFGEGIRTDIAHWAKIVKDADIKISALLEAKGKELGDTLTVSRFVRFGLGE